MYTSEALQFVLRFIKYSYNKHNKKQYIYIYLKFHVCIPLLDRVQCLITETHVGSVTGE